ncbi:MAG: hypothetical protein QXL20_00305 [Candidatus Bathyarchaeia archaeon]
MKEGLEGKLIEVYDRKLIQFLGLFFSSFAGGQKQEHRDGRGSILVLKIEPHGLLKED